MLHFTWELALCAVCVLACVAASVYLIWRYEGSGRAAAQGQSSEGPQPRYCIYAYQTYLRYLTLSPNLSQIHNQTTTLYKVVHSVILHVFLCVSDAHLKNFLPKVYIERIGILVGGMYDVSHG
jgi:hypothetical protein